MQLSCYFLILFPVNVIKIHVNVIKNNFCDVGNILSPSLKNVKVTLLFACMCVSQCLCGGQKTTSGGGSVLVFYHIGSRDQTQTVKFGGNHLSRLSHLSGFIFKNASEHAILHCPKWHVTSHGYLWDTSNVASMPALEMNHILTC